MTQLERWCMSCCSQSRLWPLSASTTSRFPRYVGSNAGRLHGRERCGAEGAIWQPSSPSLQELCSCWFLSQRYEDLAPVILSLASDSNLKGGGILGARALGCLDRWRASAIPRSQI